MRRLTPHQQHLLQKKKRCLEVVKRLGSYHRAAKELGIGVQMVRHYVKSIEPSFDTRELIWKVRKQSLIKAMEEGCCETPGDLAQKLSITTATLYGWFKRFDITPPFKVATEIKGREFTHWKVLSGQLYKQIDGTYSPDKTNRANKTVYHECLCMLCDTKHYVQRAYLLRGESKSCLSCASKMSGFQTRTPIINTTTDKAYPSINSAVKETGIPLWKLAYHLRKEKPLDGQLWKKL